VGQAPAKPLSLGAKHDQEFLILAPSKFVVVPRDYLFSVSLVASARSLIQTASYLVVKSVAIMLSASAAPVDQGKLDAALALTRDICEPTWSNPFVSWREYLSTDNDDPEFTVAKTEADGFTIQNLHLSPEIFKHAVPFSGKR
jgi:hypothetical protein